MWGAGIRWLEEIAFLSNGEGSPVTVQDLVALILVEEGARGRGEGNGCVAGLADGPW